MPDAKARMIRLEQKQSAVAAAAEAPVSLAVQPFSYLVLDKGISAVLSVDKEFVDRFEKTKELERLASSDAAFDAGDLHIAVVSTRVFAENRILRECVAIRRR